MKPITVIKLNHFTIYSSTSIFAVQIYYRLWTLNGGQWLSVLLQAYIKPSSLACFCSSVVAQGSLRSSKIDRPTARILLKQFLLPRSRDHIARLNWIILLRMRRRVGAYSNGNYGTFASPGCCHLIGWAAQCVAVPRQSLLTQASLVGGTGESRDLLPAIFAPIQPLLYSSYAELLTTHSQWRLLIQLCIRTPPSCCIAPSPPAKTTYLRSMLRVPLFWTAVNPTRLLLTQLHLGQLEWEWMFLKHQPHPPCQIERTLILPPLIPPSFTVSETLHLFVYSPFFFNNKTSNQWHIPTCHFRRSSSRPSCVGTVFECMCEQVMGESDVG